jgi:hypothetical protein
MTSTNEAALSLIMIPAIEAIDPRVAFQGSAFNAYVRKGEGTRNEPRSTGPKLTGSRSRRFRLDWDGIGTVVDGIHEENLVETESSLIVRVDYAGTADEQATIKTTALSDWRQISDVLMNLKSTSNGLMFVRIGARPERTVASEAPDVTIYDFSYLVRFMGTTDPN